MRSNHRDNLLLNLVSYTPRKERSALEDFCTETLAWCLRNCPTFRADFLEALDPAIKNNQRVGVETQTCYECDDPDNPDAGRLDLVIQVADDDVLAIVEVKARSNFGSDQLTRYRKELERQVRFKRRILATLTDKQEKADNADVHITWSRVCRLLEDQACTTTTPDIAATVCFQFAEFLKEKGLGPMDLPRIVNEPLKHWAAGVRYFKRLEDILNSLKNDPLLEPIVGRKRVTFEDRDRTIWVGIYGNQQDFWIGFALKERDESNSIHMLVQKTVVGDRRIEFSHYQPDVADGKTWLNIEREVDKELDGNGEMIKEWLLGSARQLLELKA